MAVNNFQEMARSLKLWVPSLPITLAEQMVRDRYRRTLERRPWSGLRGENQFLLNASKQDGTVAVTFNSASVVGTGTSFASTDVGRQFKVGTGSPVYTVTAVADTTHLTLDQVVGIATNTSATYVIFDGYVTCPTDFVRFIEVVNPQYGWRLRHWISQDELNSWDPQRTFFGQAYALVDRRFSSLTATSGQIQYEAWPYASTQQVLRYFYVKRGSDLVNPTDTPIFPIRSDVIVKGALADAARWPGTAEQPNLMFGRVDAWQTFQGEYEEEMIDLERQDEDIYLTWLQTNPYAGLPFIPLSANFIQSHAI